MLGVVGEQGSEQECSQLLPRLESCKRNPVSFNTHCWVMHQGALWTGPSLLDYKTALLELTQGTFRLSFSQSTHTCRQAFPEVSTYIPQVLEVPIMS